MFGIFDKASRHSTHGKRARRIRPQLELLEDRTLLSTTWTVKPGGGGDFTTISAAVAAATVHNGDTILVDPGTYLESVAITKSLTLEGAQHGVDARTRSVPMSQESVVGTGLGAFQIMADNVVIDGFIVQGVNVDPNVNPASFGAGIWSNPGFSGTHGGFHILNNIVQNNIIGIELANDGTIQAQVKFNLVRNNTQAGAGGGAGIRTDFSLANAVIDQNDFTGHTTGAQAAILLFASGGSNIVISNNHAISDGQIGVVGASNVTITRNTSVNSYGIGLILVNGTASVDHNVILNSLHATGSLRLRGGVDGVNITSNTIANGQGSGIAVEDPFSVGSNSNNHIHANNIAGNVKGATVVAGTNVGTLDAKSNWWGSASGPGGAGPGTGNSVSAGIDFSSFLTGASASAPPVIKFQTASQSIVAGAVSGPITIQFLDANNLPIKAVSNLVIGLTTSSAFGQFLAMNGATQITSVTIAAGASTAQFRYRDYQAGNPVITAKLGGLTASTKETIRSNGIPPQLLILLQGLADLQKTNNPAALLALLAGLKPKLP